MNNPNPFVPQGSLLEQKNKRRSRVKLAVFCVVAINVLGLTAMLMQGCKREQTEAENQPPVDTNVPPVMDTNPPPVEATNPPVQPPVVAQPARCAGSRRDRIRRGQGRHALENRQEKWRDAQGH